MKILFVSPEVVPFASTGGLGEVAGSLPEALNAQRTIPCDCRVIMPLYKQAKEKYLGEMRFLGATSVPLSWRRQHVGLFSLKKKHTTYYFIDNEYYFNRDGLYGYYDDGERFTYFSKAVFEALNLMDFAPDIIHANDWQTALIPVFQTAVYHRDFMKTIFTIHNVQYQGNYGEGIYDSVLDLPESERHLLAMGENVNYMKGGIECANIVSTVSPTYANELMDPFYAFGMEDIVKRNSHKLAGILNGINTSLYNPAKDKAIAANFSKADPSGKALCKKALQKELGLPESDAPMLVMIVRLALGKGVDLVMPIMDRLLYDNDMQFVLLGTGEAEFEDYFRGLERRHPDKMRALIRFDSALSHRIYAAGDMIMVPSRSEPCGLTQMIGCRYGTVPIVRETGGLRDSIKDCSLGEGNGFVFSGYSPEELKSAIERALGLYRNSEDWQNLVKYDLAQDFSWNISAKEYAKLYTSVMKG